MRARSFLSLVIVVGASATAVRADALQLINNGGFESGLTGWSTGNQGSGSFYVQSGTSSPGGFAVASPSGPTHAAMTDQSGPGTHLLFQDFVVPFNISAASVQFDEYINNHAGVFYSPATLDTGVSNQQARVDIMTTTANPYSVATGDVLANVFQTHPGDATISGYNTIQTDLTALLQSLAGQTLRLRFAEADNQSNFNFGVDRVSLDVTTTAAPLPSSGWTCLALLGSLAGFGLRRRLRTTRC